MNKLITHKREVNGSIKSCKVMAFGSQSFEEVKSTIIKNINDGQEYRTFSNGKIGALVKVIDNSYLRTDSNNTSKDNLDNLPNY